MQFSTLGWPAVLIGVSHFLISFIYSHSVSYASSFTNLRLDHEDFLILIFVSAPGLQLWHVKSFIWGMWDSALQPRDKA